MEVREALAAREGGGAEFDTGAACLVILLRFFGLPGDAAQLRHRFADGGQALDTTAILRAAKELGLKAKSLETDWSRLTKTPLPAIATGTDGRYVILAKIDGERVLVQDPTARRAVEMTREAFEDFWSGDLVLVTRRAKAFGQGGKFDVSWFIPAIIRYRRLFTEVFVASFFLQLFALVSPLFFMVVIDKVLVHRGLTTLDVLVFGLIVVSVFEVLLGALRTYIFSHTTNRVDVELGAKLFRHLLALPMSYFGARRVDDSVARVRELDNIRNFLTGSALTLVIDLFFTFVFLGVMWIFSPTLTLIVLASIPCYVVLSIVVTPVLRNRLQERFQRGAENQAFLVEAVTGIETLKSMAVGSESQRRWEEQLAAYVKASFKATNLNNIAGQVAQLINKLTLALTLYFGAKLVLTGELTVGQFVAFNMLSARVSAPVLRLAQLWQDFQQARISIERLGDILNTPTEPMHNPNRAALPRIDGRIRFDGVTFRYRTDGPEALRRISLDIPAGQIVGIVGPSGSGKSTLAKLVQRLHVPESGRVLVDGVDLAMIDATWLRRQIGVVLQDALLFNRSARDNIALADPGMPMDQVVRAATLAGAHEFILELPEGYDTQIGERGSTLSGGQRQRIAIARALATDPRILILDEATSALDYESERIVQQNMEAICHDRTVVIIAHRLTTVRHAQRILTIEAGEVVEDGTHGELVRLDGRYARLHQLQVGSDAAD